MKDELGAKAILLHADANFIPSKSDDVSTLDDQITTLNNETHEDTEMHVLLNKSKRDWLDREERYQEEIQACRNTIMELEHTLKSKLPDEAMVLRKNQLEYQVGVHEFARRDLFVRLEDLERMLIQVETERDEGLMSLRPTRRELEIAMSKLEVCLSFILTIIDRDIGASSDERYT
jgi:hypothetical protein